MDQVLQGHCDKPQGELLLLHTIEECDTFVLGDNFAIIMLHLPDQQFRAHHLITIPLAPAEVPVPI